MASGLASVATFRNWTVDVDDLPEAGTREPTPLGLSIETETARVTYTLK